MGSFDSALGISIFPDGLLGFQQLTRFFCVYDRREIGELLFCERGGEEMTNSGFFFLREMLLLF